MNEFCQFKLTNICYRITRKCNLKCSFCLAANTAQELSTQQVKESILNLKEIGMKKIRITGGEPTTRLDLIEIIKYCYELNLDVLLYSNLYKIDYIFDDLVTLPVLITTSLHGNETYHNKITGINAYQYTYNNIVKLIEKGKEVNVHYVLTYENYEYIEDLLKQLIKIGVKKVTFQTIIPRERAKENIKNIVDNYLQIKQQLNLIQILAVKYKEIIKVKTIDFYEKYYYVFEPDGCLYLQKETESKDELVRRII